jgi:hypothetical protein
MPRGPKHTFLRADGQVARPNYCSGNELGVFYRQDKPGGSVELIGRFYTVDEFALYAGTVILARDSRFEPGRNSTTRVEKGARLVLLDGAYFGKWVNDMRQVDMMLKGTIQGGLPDRPLTRDCRLGLGFQNWNDTELGQSTEFTGKQKSDRVRRDCLTRKADMIAEPGAAIRTYRKAGSDASLVIGWHGIEKTWNLKELAQWERKHGRRIPRRITAYFDSGTTVDGVKFDHVHAGGILFKDRATRAGWTNITFGEHCGGGPEELFRHLPGGVSRKGVWGAY